MKIKSVYQLAVWDELDSTSAAESLHPSEQKYSPSGRHRQTPDSLSFQIRHRRSATLQLPLRHGFIHRSIPCHLNIRQQSRLKIGDAGMPRDCVALPQLSAIYWISLHAVTNLTSLAKSQLSHRIPSANPVKQAGSHNDGITI
jgi:hypothetical protein